MYFGFFCVISSAVKCSLNKHQLFPAGARAHELRLELCGSCTPGESEPVSIIAWFIPRYLYILLLQPKWPLEKGLGHIIYHTIFVV